MSVDALVPEAIGGAVTAATKPATPANPATHERVGHDRNSGLGSVLLGALAAAMIAGRFETAALAIGVGAVGAALAGAGVPRRPWWTALAWGGGLAIVLNLYLIRGTPLRVPLLGQAPAFELPRVFGAPATLPGLAAGLLLTLRLAGAALAVHALRAAWPAERAADELAVRVAPLERAGVPVREARAMIGLALRFAPLLAAECRRIARLQALRAGRAPRGWRETLAARRAVAVPAVVAAIETAERVATGLEARHYRLRPVAAPGGGRAAALLGWLVVGVAALWRA